MTSKREVHTLAVLNVPEDCRQFVGLPTFHDMKCNRSHKYTSKCDHCRWNICQNCGGTPKLRQFSGEFNGWTGLCDPCIAKGICNLPTVPEEWKEVYTPPKAAGGAKKKVELKSDACIVISDDDESSPTKQQKKDSPIFPGEWEVPPSGDIRDYAEFLLYDITQPVIKERYAKEILSVVDLLVQGRIKCDEMKNPIPVSLSAVLPAPHIRLVKLFRVQNAHNLRMFLAEKEEVTYINDKRPAQDKASVIEGIAFHGTSKKAAESVSMHGSRMEKNSIGAYGGGFYSSVDLTAIPIAYAVKNGQPPEEHAIVVGRVIIGRNQQSGPMQDIPNPGFDTGGCGRGWIHTTFKNHHFHATHYLVFEISTRQEFEDQVKVIKEAAAAAVIPKRGEGGSVPRASSLSQPPVVRALMPRPPSILKPPRPQSPAVVLAPPAVVLPAAIPPPVVVLPAAPPAVVLLPPTVVLPAAPPAVALPAALPPPAAPPAVALPPPAFIIPHSAVIIPAAVPSVLIPVASPIQQAAVSSTSAVAAPGLGRLSVSGRMKQALWTSKKAKVSPSKPGTCGASQYKVTPPTSEDDSVSDGDDPAYTPGSTRGRK
jgi:hypothetical protein